MDCIIYTDGAARGNPGPAGAGAIILNTQGAVVDEVSVYLGELTNNQAEYRALLLALKKAKSCGAKKITVYSDSELMVKHLRGEYKVKNEGLKPLFEEAKKILNVFESFKIDHVFREKNKRADALANQAIDSAK